MKNRYTWLFIGIILALPLGLLAFGFNPAQAYHLAKGSWSFLQSDLHSAMLELEQANVEKPTYYGYFLQGTVGLAANRHEIAVSAYDRALEFDESSIEARKGRAMARWRMGDYLGAEKDFSWVIALGKAEADTYYNRGYSRLQTGNIAGAILDLEKAAFLYEEIGNEEQKTKAENLLELSRDSYNI